MSHSLLSEQPDAKISQQRAFYSKSGTESAITTHTSSTSKTTAPVSPSPRHPGTHSRAHSSMFRRPILCHVLCHGPLRRTRTYEIESLIRLPEDRRAEVERFVGWRFHCLISIGQLVSSAPDKDSTTIKGAKDKAMYDPSMEARG